ncbi:MAG: hypothetical protein JO349_08220, partial [Candidatus Eremiobacteraeota bacterium]|nr:hypothetical protein [Candidatus Eremiobacteraeota bacterium]
MRPVSFAAIAFALAVALVHAALAQQPPAANPALNAPDQVAWMLFLQANADASTPGNHDATFETWPNDGDTFRPKPAARFTQRHQPLRLSPRALFVVHALPPGGAGEETHRNPAAYDFIVANHLYSTRGLQAAFG